MELKKLLQDCLLTNVVLVRFKKADGSIRDMQCTLMEDYIGVVSHSNTSGPEHLITVWDIENEGWRSFKVDSVLTFRAFDFPNQQVA